MIWSHSAPARTVRYTHRPSSRWCAPAARRSGAGGALCTSSHSRVVAHGRDEGVGHRHREVEVGEPAVVLGVDERLDVGMIAAQDAHLRAAPRARRLHGLAALVEHPHVGERSAGAAVRALDVRALRADGREVVAHAAAAAHGLGGLVQRHVDADAVLVAGDAVAHRLDEAIDQRGLEVRARGGIDPPAEDEAVLLRLQERLLPLLPLLPGASTAASARATRRRTASTVCSSPLAYFSRRISSEIDCGGNAAGAAGRRVLRSSSFMGTVG